MYNGMKGSIVKKIVIWVVCLFYMVFGAKDCVFLHGTGVHTTTGPVTTFPAYWGSVESYTTQCASSIFIHQDTVTRPFNDPALMQAYCSLAVNGATGKHKIVKGLNATINNKIVFTHSYGNNVMAAAIKHGYCDFGSTSSWYEVSGPLYGSKAAYFLDQVCIGNASSILRWLADELGYCIGSTEAPAYVSLQPTNPDLNGLAGIVRARIKGAFCGDSSFGLPTKYALALTALADLVQYGQPNDGMVPISSCDVTGNSYGSSPQNSWYMAGYNHADATCRNGGTPCTWYSYRT